jgi:hypothetical protein
MTRFWLDPFSVPIEVDGDILPARAILRLGSGLTAVDDEENDATELQLTVGVELEPPITITNTEPADVPLTVKGAASQAAHLQDWKNSSGTVVAAVTAAGAMILALSTGVVHADASGNLTSSAIVNADVSASAAIATSKLGQSGATSGQFLAWNGSAWAPSSTVPAADASTTGGIRLTQDLGGTATAPTVVALTGTANVVTVRGTTIQWGSTVAGPTITQASTSIAAGATLTIQAQAGDGGGGLTLKAGSTTISDGTGGSVLVQAGDGTLGDGDGGSIQLVAGTGNDENGSISFAVGQSAEIDFFVNSVTVAQATGSGFGVFGSLSVSGTTALTGTSNAVQLVVRANATQTAHLVDFKNTSNAVSAYVTQDGKIVANAAGASCFLQGFASAESTIGVLYLGQNSPGGANYTLLGNTSGATYLNAATSPILFLIANGTVGSAGSDGDGIFLSVGGGGTISTAGAVRLANNRYIAARNAAGGGNVNMWKINASDQLQTGVLTTAGHVLTDSSGIISSAVDLVAKNKTADESVTSSTTLQNDDHLVLAILANETWVIRFALYVTYASGDGIKIAITLPSGATMLLLGQMVTDSAETTIFQHTTTGGGAVVLQPGEATTESLVIVDVTVVNSSNAGNVQLQFAQNNSSGTATVIKQNSSFTAVRK